MAVKSFGLDIGAKYTKLVVMDWRKDVLHAAHVPTPYRAQTGAPDTIDVDRLLESFGDAFPLRAFQRSKLATCIHSSYVAATMVSLPPMPQKEMTGAAVFEARRTMIPAPGADALFESLVVGAKSAHKTAKPELLVLKTERQGLDERLGSLKQAGLIPRIITTSSFALLNAAARKDLQKNHLAIIHFGATTLDITIAQKGKQRFFRSVNFGCRHLAIELSKMLGTSEDQAEQRLLAHSFTGSVKTDRPESANEDPSESAVAADQAKIQQLTQPYVERLVNEIRRSLAFYTEHSGQRVEKILLSGGGIMIPNLPSHWDRILGGEIQILDPFQHARMDEGFAGSPIAQAPLYAAAFGLAQILQEPGRRRRHEIVNFLPFEVKQRQQRILKTMLSLQLGLFLMAGVTAFWLKAKHEVGSLKTSIAIDESAARSLEPYVARQREHDALRQSVQGRLSMIDGLRASHPNGPAILRDVERSVPEGILLTSLALQKRQDEPGAGRFSAGSTPSLDEDQMERDPPRPLEGGADRPVSFLQKTSDAKTTWRLQLEGEITDRYEAAAALAEAFRARLARSQHLQEVTLVFPPLEQIEPRTTAEGRVELTQPQRYVLQIAATVK